MFEGEAVEPPASIDAPPRRRLERHHWLAAAGGVIVLAVVVFFLLFQWNWLRGPLARLISARVHRPVAIRGDLEVHPWSWTPTVVINDMTVADAPWSGPAPMVVLPRLTAKVELLPLFTGQTVFPLVVADRPRVRLLHDGEGRANWNFGGGVTAGRPSAPPIGHLVIRDGAVRLTDVRRRIAFAGVISTDETAARGRDLGGTRISGALSLANPAWAGPGDAVRAPRFTLQTDLFTAMRGHLALSLVEADGGTVRLVRDAAGRENWLPTPGPKLRPLKVPPIGNLVITGSALRYDDARRDLHFVGAFSSSERMAAGRGVFELKGQGALDKEPFVALLTGGPLLHVDKTRPYRFDAHIRAGATAVTMVGAIARPFDLKAIAGSVTARGQDFGELSKVTGLALPMTPPYTLAAAFSRVGAVYAFRNVHGRVGDSDLAGALSVDDSSGRPFLTADLTSRRLQLADLAPAFGGAPRNPAGHTVSPAEKVIAARLRAEHRLLPDTPLDMKRVRGMDARVSFKAQSVAAGSLPIRALAIKLALDHGVLTLDPLAMSLPQGDIAGKIRIDARANMPLTSMDVSVSNARLETLVRGRGGPAPLQGGVFARAKLAGAGASVHAAAAAANGQLSIVIPGGEIRQALAELMGIDAAKGLFLLLSKSQQQTPIRCGVADFQATNGVLTVRRIVFDTGVVLVSGSGVVDMRDETFNLRLSGKPKKFRLVRIAAPITLKGSWEAPKFGVDVGKAAGQLVISGLLGAFVSPAVLILPFVSPGLAHNANCASLTASGPN
jgi:hypothetical protein